MRRITGNLSFITSLLILFLASPTPGGCIDYEQLSWNSAINWEKGTITLDVEVDLSKEDSFLPSVRQEAEHTVEKYLSYILRESVKPINIDSYLTADTVLENSSHLIHPLEQRTEKGVKQYGKFSSDMNSFLLQYRYSLFPDIVSLFINHTYPYDPPRILDYEPTTDFSGIVIYAKGSYPVHGEEVTAELRPCFFPTLYDVNMRVIVEEGMVQPSFLEKWGLAAYTSEVDEKPFVERIGFTPLRTMAVALFGKNRTDIIIPENAARKILSSAANRQLLTEGRILIICDNTIQEQEVNP